MGQPLEFVEPETHHSAVFQRLARIASTPFNQTSPCLVNFAVSETISSLLSTISLAVAPVVRFKIADRCGGWLELRSTVCPLSSSYMSR